MNWTMPTILMVVGSILIFIGGYLIGHKRAKDELQTVGELIIYDFIDGTEPELYLNLDASPKTFKTLSHVIFQTRNVKVRNSTHSSQK